MKIKWQYLLIVLSFIPFTYTTTFINNSLSYDNTLSFRQVDADIECDYDRWLFIALLLQTGGWESIKNGGLSEFLSIIG